MAKPCAKAGSCGGCCFSGVRYSVQLEKKQQYVEDLLDKFAPVAPIYPMEEPYYYRNKVQSVFGYDSKHRVISGIYRFGTHHLIGINGCMIENQTADAVLETIKGLVKKFGLSIYDEDLQTGFLRHVLIRIAVATGQVLVVLVTSSYEFRQHKSFVAQLVEKHPEVKTVLINKNDEKTSMVLSEGPVKVLYGDGYIQDVLCDLTFRISARSFYQVNPVQAQKLFTTAMKMARLKGNERIIDAYCGTGTIGLIAATYTKGPVVGIELNPDAVEDAKTNAKINGIDNATFICGDASVVLKQMAKDKEQVDVVFLDPPRAGSDERFLASVIKLAPSTVVYISCNPDTLERDLRYLTKMGPYKVLGIQPVDMFPHTEHVETVVLFLNQNAKTKYHVNVGIDAEEYYRVKESR